MSDYMLERETEENDCLTNKELTTLEEKFKKKVKTNKNKGEKKEKIFVTDTLTKNHEEEMCDMDRYDSKGHSRW